MYFELSMNDYYSTYPYVCIEFSGTCPAWTRSNRTRCWIRDQAQSGDQYRYNNCPRSGHPILIVKFEHLQRINQ